LKSASGLGRAREAIRNGRCRYRCRLEDKSGWFEDAVLDAVLENVLVLGTL